MERYVYLDKKFLYRMSNTAKMIEASLNATIVESGTFTDPICGLSEYVHLKSKPKWTLHRQTIFEHVYHYAWVDPDGVIRFNRVIVPLGYGRMDAESLAGKRLKELRKENGYPWRRVATKMTQAQLAQGWLC